MNFLSSIIDWLIALVGKLGYFGIFIGTTIESTVFPFPLELILPPAGVLVARGEMSFAGVLSMAILGSIAGALINYYLAYHLGRKAVNSLLLRYGKVFFIKEESLIKSEAFFQKHGEITTLVGRLIPGIRSFVSLPAGFYKMNLARFCFFTGLGAGIWSALLIYVGIIYGENESLVSGMIDSFAWVIVGAALALVVGYIIYRKFKK